MGEGSLIDCASIDARQADQVAGNGGFSKRSVLVHGGG
jgi:hypothetical protein